MNNVGNAIRFFLTYKGMTVRDLYQSMKAMGIKISYSYLTMLVTKERKAPSIPTTMNIAKALNVPFPVFAFYMQKKEDRCIGMTEEQIATITRFMDSYCEELENECHIKPPAKPYL